MIFLRNHLIMVGKFINILMK